MKRIDAHVPVWGQLLGWWSLTALILWIRCEGIHMEGDPLVYARLAFLDSQGLPPWQEWTFTTRTGLLAPVSWIISMAGVSVASLLAWSVLSFFLLVTGIWIRRDTLPGGMWILTGLLLLPWPSAYAVMLLPDAPMLCFAGLALLCIPSEHESNRNYFIRSCLFGIFLTISLLCKLTVLYVIPVCWALVFLIERRKNWGFHVGGLITCGLLLGLLFLADSPFFDRFTNIDQDHNLSPFSYSWQDPQRMIGRLLLEPFQLFWANPGVAALIFPTMLGLFHPDKDLRWIKWGFLMLLLIHWGGSSSLTRYTPLPADPRMWILLSIPMLLLAAAGLRWRWEESSGLSGRKMMSWLFLLVLTGVGAVVMRNLGYHLALGVGLLLLPVKWKSRMRMYGLGLLFVFWLGYQGWNRSSAYYQQAEQNLVEEFVPEKGVLFADPVLKFGEFLYTEDSAQIQLWPDSIPSTPGSFFLWNGTRVQQANLFSDRIVLPAYIPQLEQTWTPIASDSLFDIRLYQSPQQPCTRLVSAPDYLSPWASARGCFWWPICFPGCWFRLTQYWRPSSQLQE